MKARFYLQTRRPRPQVEKHLKLLETMAAWGALPDHRKNTGVIEFINRSLSEISHSKFKLNLK